MYQEGAVSAYFDDRSTPPHYIANSEASNIRTGNGVFNRAGRGIPDVSAIGAFLPIYINGTRFATLFNGTRKVAIEINEWGTSLSAPIFASVIDLLNEERLNVGKSPVGFVNPALYAHPEVLNDIINGSNPACDSPGFQAAKGWDPVTGMPKSWNCSESMTADIVNDRFGYAELPCNVRSVHELAMTAARGPVLLVQRHVVDEV